MDGHASCESTGAEQNIRKAALYVHFTIGRQEELTVLVAIRSERLTESGRFSQTWANGVMLSEKQRFARFSRMH
jgi:hypothetical protein